VAGGNWSEFCLRRAWLQCSIFALLDFRAHNIKDKAVGAAESVAKAAKEQAEAAEHAAHGQRG